MRPVCFRGMAPRGSGWPRTGTPWPSGAVGRRTGDSSRPARPPFPPTAQCRACFPTEPVDAGVPAPARAAQPAARPPLLPRTVRLAQLSFKTVARCVSGAGPNRWFVGRRFVGRRPTIGSTARERRRKHPTSASIFQCRTIPTKLLNSLQAARATGTYERKRKQLAGVPVLIVDEFALKPLRAPESDQAFSSYFHLLRRACPQLSRPRIAGDAQLGRGKFLGRAPDFASAGDRLPCVFRIQRRLARCGFSGWVGLSAFVKKRCMLSHTCTS
jgi:hypothetical protein